MRIRNAYEFIEKEYAKHFKLHEWPNPDDLRYVHPSVIENLDILREEFGHPIYPSKDSGGLVRRSGSTTSRHYIGDGYMGLAVDVFPSINALECWLKAIEMNDAWYGIGIYFDTNVSKTQPQPMLHLDIDSDRGHRVFWTRVDGEYIMKHDDPKRFWNSLSKAYDHKYR